MIGGRVFAAVGALVVVIGIALFLKYGIDRGWFAMAPVWKCLFGAGFGALLLGAGEVARRKVNAMASAGLSAAGLGAMYASAWAARARFELVGDEAAFALLALTTALGVAVALRARLLSVAVLSIVGAYLTPFIVKADAPSPVVLPVYSLALLALGLVLSSWRAEPFRPLRSVTWWGTVAVGSIWTLMNAREHPMLAGAYYLAFWVAVHAEMFISARRDEGRIFATEEEEEGAVAHPATPARPGYRAVLMSFGTTVWAVGLGTIVMRSPVALVSDWFVTAGGFVAALCVGLMVAGNLRLIRDVPRTTAQRLGAGLMMQAGALLIATVALGLTGQTEAAAWLAMGVAAVGAGRWLRARALDAYGLVVLVIGAARLVAFDSWAAGAATPIGTSGGFVLSWWMGLMVCAAGAWLGAARLILIGAGDAWRRAAAAAAAVGVGLLFASLLHEDVHRPSLAWGWLALSVGVGIASIWQRQLKLEWIGAAGLAVTSLAWQVGYPAWESTVTVIPAFVLGLCLWGVATAAGWLLRVGREHSFSLVAFGLMALAVTCVRLVFARDALAASDPGMELAGLVISTWTVLMVIAGAVWLVSAVLLLRKVEADWRPAVVGVAAIGIALVFASLMVTGVSVSSLAWAWLGLAIGTALAAALERRLHLEWIGIGFLLPTVGAWLVSYPLTEWTDRAGLIHPGAVLGVALIAACIGLTRWALRGQDDERFRRLAFGTGLGIAAAMFLLVSSMEVMRGAQILTADEMVRASVLSIWWGLYGVALVAAGFTWRAAICRYCGLGLIVLATTKVVFVDFAEVPELWRIASFVGLGLLMLAVAVAYFKLAAALEGGAARLEKGGTA